jgi:hypothetical protein
MAPPSAGRGPGYRTALFIAGVLVGVFLLGALRFAVQEPEHDVHYHANWAVFLDGERLDLSGRRYMEDVAQCTADPSHQRPEDRVHMHDGNQDVVHVHAGGATWGHLLANLGFGIGDDYLETDEALYRDGGGRSLKFVLNGSRTRSIRNLQIGDEDRLLISFGHETPEEVLEQQFPHVAADAGRYNRLPDPASCAGHHEPTLSQRLVRAFWY